MGDATHHNQWARLSVNFWTDPKVLACDHVARSVFVASIAVAGQHLSDGVVHRHTMRLYAGDDGTLEDAAGQLVGVGLWEPVGDGMSWRICSYLKWNDSRADVRRARIKRLLGGVAGRHKRYHKAEKDSQCPFCVTGCSTVEQLMRHEQFSEVTGYSWHSVWHARPAGLAIDADADADADADETVVSFTGRGNPRASERTPAKQETISAGWKPTARTLNDAGKAGATAAMIERHIPRFRDHHLAKGTCAVDFGPMFVNWIRRALELEQPNGTTPAPAGSTGERRVTAGYHRYVDFTDDQWT